MLTDYQARYFAYALTREGGIGAERLQQSLLNASVDLNPHQIDAALFALHSPLSKGVILADEVGLGKTIEAGLILCQLWAERKRRLLVVCPASLRRQWQDELYDKFNLQADIIDAKSFRDLEKNHGQTNPFESTHIVITSYNYAAIQKDYLKTVQWDLVIMDEAHKLRNAHQTSNQIGNSLRFALKDRKKVLLTATPIQNRLTELYGISTIIDESLFGDLPTFRSRYANENGDLDALRERLKDFCHRTLRNDVQEYVKYTDRKPLTAKFTNTDREQSLYSDLSAYLQDKTTYAFPQGQREMLTQGFRKLLASSPTALIGTLEKILERLDKMTPGRTFDEAGQNNLLEGEEDILDALAEDEAEARAEAEDDAAVQAVEEDGLLINGAKLRQEKELVRDFIERAKTIAAGVDSKTQKLLEILDSCWAGLRQVGAAEKAVIFTESVRSMVFLKRFLEANGYADKVACFSGGGRRDPTSEQIYQDYKRAHPENNSSKSVMVRHAIVEHFKKNAQILIATEAGAEGINLQFCSLVINYDLPWNPQRVEQRIGRCHRYGQRHDVVVLNFLNTRNAADARVLELLTDRFKLFSSIFGASNDVLGLTDARGQSLQQRVNEILNSCRTDEEINRAFDQLQRELADQINARMEETRQRVIDNLDVTVADRLRDTFNHTRTILSEAEFQFWELTKHMLREHADEFDDKQMTFRLIRSPISEAGSGVYSFNKKNNIGMVYRPNSPLGEWVIQQAKALNTAYGAANLTFENYHGARLALAEGKKGRRGFLLLNRLRLNSLAQDEFLLFSAVTDRGEVVDHETCRQLFRLNGVHDAADTIPAHIREKLLGNSQKYAESTLFQFDEANLRLFREEMDRLDRKKEDKLAIINRTITQLQSRRNEAVKERRLATTMDDQLTAQDKIKRIDQDIRNQRTRIGVEEEKTNKKIEEIENEMRARMHSTQDSEILFTLQWKVA